MTIQHRSASGPLRVHGFLIDVLAALREIERDMDDGPFEPVVERVQPDLYRIEFDDGCAMAIDTARCVVDDPAWVMPGDWKARLPWIRRYRIVWRDGDGIPQEATVEAGSRRTARAIARAPEGAYVEWVLDTGAP